jgi:hypothetical protein
MSGENVDDLERIQKKMAVNLKIESFKTMELETQRELAELNGRRETWDERDRKWAANLEDRLKSYAIERAKLMKELAQIDASE